MISDSFTIELWRYVLDSQGEKFVATSPSRWSRHWSNPSEGLTEMYQHILEIAQEWQTRHETYGGHIELIADGERLRLIDFPPRGKPDAGI